MQMDMNVRKKLVMKVGEWEMNRKKRKQEMMGNRTIRMHYVYS